MGTHRLFLFFEGGGSAVEVVDVYGCVEESVGEEEGGLYEPVEVDGWVVGDEGCTEIHEPGWHYVSFSELIEKHYNLLFSIANKPLLFFFYQPKPSVLAVFAIWKGTQILQAV